MMRALRKPDDIFNRGRAQIALVFIAILLLIKSSTNSHIGNAEFYIAVARQRSPD